MEDLDQITEEEIEPEEEGSWMATFADLMSLLLTFFVLLLSFAQMDIIKFRDALGSLKDAFGYVDGTQGMNPTKSSSVIELPHQKNDSFVKQPVDMKYKERSQQKIVVNENEEILQRVMESINRNNLNDMVKAEITGRGVVVRVEGQLFFNSGSAVLKKEAYPLLDDIIRIGEEFPYMMSVEGHTDNTPINTLQFPSNWELSTARAISALRYILQSGRIPPERLGASGYADTRPVASNATLEGRQKNRRVEFIFFKE